MITINKKIDWVFTEVEITSNMKEFNDLSNIEKQEIIILELQKELNVNEVSLEKLQDIKEKQELIDKVYQDFNEKLAVINSKYTPEERETFEIKRVEAEKVLGGWTSAFLEALCIEWETVEELANKIKTNSENFQELYASAEKKLREDLNAINS